ncbi:MAG: HAMP domain-containing protein [Cellvibrionaceae bacterium]
MKDNNIKFLLSVQTKIIFIAILVITLVLGGYSIYEVSRRQALMNSEMNDLAKISASKLENNLRIPLWDLDNDLIADVVETEMLTRDISAILVFDTDNSGLIIGRQRGANWGILDVDKSYEAIGSDEIKKEVFVVNKNEKIGRVIVYVNKKFKKSELIESVKGLLATLLLLDIAVFIILWFVMSEILRRPISQLTDAANKVSRGNFDVDIDIQRRDEIGQVANAIDRMKISLSMAIRRLREIENIKKRKKIIK